MSGRLYYTDSIVPVEDDPDRVAAGAAEGSDYAYIGGCVDLARSVLNAEGSGAPP